MKKQVCYFNLAILGVAIFLTLSIPAPAARAGQIRDGICHAKGRPLEFEPIEGKVPKWNCKAGRDGNDG